MAFSSTPSSSFWPRSKINPLFPQYVLQCAPFFSWIKWMNEQVLRCMGGGPPIQSVGPFCLNHLTVQRPYPYQREIFSRWCARATHLFLPILLISDFLHYPCAVCTSLLLSPSPPPKKKKIITFFDWSGKPSFTVPLGKWPQGHPEAEEACLLQC